jgi:hypothetical protein
MQVKTHIIWWKSDEGVLDVAVGSQSLVWQNASFNLSQTKWLSQCFPYVPWVICPWTSQRGKPCSSLPPDIARLHQLLLIWGYLKMSQTLSGWWFQPLWKILISQIGSSSQLLGKTKNVPNHQLVMVLPSFFYLKIARKFGVLHSGIQRHFEERKPVVHPWRNFKPCPVSPQRWLRKKIVPPSKSTSTVEKSGRFQAWRLSLPNPLRDLGWQTVSNLHPFKLRPERRQEPSPFWNTKFGAIDERYRGWLVNVVTCTGYFCWGLW